MPQYSMRVCSVADAPMIARHRVEMFRDMGDIPSEELACHLLEVSSTAIAKALDDGTYFGWFAIDELGQVVAGAGVHIKPQLPRIASDGSHVADSQVPLVVNVYTEPGHRKRGLARRLMVTVMSWASSKGFDRIVLHASEAGRPLYESLGFSATNEMRWKPPGGQTGS